MNEKWVYCGTLEHKEFDDLMRVCQQQKSEIAKLRNLFRAANAAKREALKCSDKWEARAETERARCIALEAENAQQKRKIAELQESHVPDDGEWMM